MHICADVLAPKQGKKAARQYTREGCRTVGRDMKRVPLAMAADWASRALLMARLLSGKNLSSLSICPHTSSHCFSLQFKSCSAAHEQPSKQEAKAGFSRKAKARHLWELYAFVPEMLHSVQNEQQILQTDAARNVKCMQSGSLDVMEHQHMCLKLLNIRVLPENTP